jgi:hypothetical protein
VTKKASLGVEHYSAIVLRADVHPRHGVVSA